MLNKNYYQQLLQKYGIDEGATSNRIVADNGYGNGLFIATEAFTSTFQIVRVFSFATINRHL